MHYWPFTVYLQKILVFVEMLLLLIVRFLCALKFSLKKDLVLSWKLCNTLIYGDLSAHVLCLRSFWQNMFTYLCQPLLILCLFCKICTTFFLIGIWQLWSKKRHAPFLKIWQFMLAKSSILNNFSIM